ncbi:MAG: hypothetical protein DMF60_06850 [Acidobacteria bacterium]|nr:MAG: hypothetical protein DMF60_06850 [Acidobacteriota bacterium]
MSDDPTKEIPGDHKQIIDKRDDDRINVLISTVQSLASDFQALSAEFQEVKVRITTLETTVNKHSYETKPIWERALAEIAATRAELAETRTELRAELKDGFRKLGAKMDVLNNDLLTVRGDQRLLEKRVEDLESKTS